MRFRTEIACCCALEAMLVGAILVGTILVEISGAQAQTAAVPRPGIGDAVRQGEQSRQPPLPAPTVVPNLPQPSEPQLTLQDRQTLHVRSITVDGAQPADDAALRGILAPYENRDLTLALIYQAADQVTTLYRSRGYLLAKAYVPAQDARGGALRLQLVVGQYGSITTKNQSLVRDSYVRGVLDNSVAESSPVQKDALERAMLLLSDLPGAGMPQVVIGPGRQPESSDFMFDVPSAHRLGGYLLGDNFGSPFTGRYRMSAGLDLNSPLGYGDRLSGFAIVSQNADLVNGRISYGFPLGYSGLRGNVAVFRTTYALGGVDKEIDATGTADGVSASLSYPLRRQRDDSIYLTGDFTHESLNDKVLDVSIANRTIDRGTLTLSQDTVGVLAGLPLVTGTTVSFAFGNVNFADPAQKAENVAGVDTAGNFARLNLSFNATLALAEKLSLAANIRAQKSLMGSLDSSEQLGLTGYWGVRSFDEGLAGDSGYIVTPELKYELPDLQRYHHSIGMFADVGAVWLENSSFTTTQKALTQLNDGGVAYYATYEYSPQRFVLLKALLARTIGTNSGAQSYDRGTKGLVQLGLTF